MSRIPQKVEFDITIRELADKNQNSHYSHLDSKELPEWVITTEKKYNSISATQVLQELINYLTDKI